MEPIVNMLVRCHHIPNNLPTSRKTGTQSHFQYHCGSMMIDWCAALFFLVWQWLATNAFRWLNRFFFFYIQCAASRDTQRQRTGSCLVSYDFFYLLSFQCLMKINWKLFICIINPGILNDLITVTVIHILMP